MSGFIDYISQRRDILQPQAETHVKIVLIALLVAIVIGLALGIAASRSRLLSSVAVSVTSALLTVPSFAMFGILAIWFGIGDTPVKVGLVLYALLPIVRNTETGLRNTDAAIIEAARGIGMSARQILMAIELPLAMPLIVAGVRQSAVLMVAVATVGAAVGSNNLGQPIFAGIRGSDDYAVLSGALPVAIIGLLLDAMLLGLQNLLSRSRTIAPNP